MFDPQPSELPSNDSLPSDQPLAKETAPTGEKILEKKPKVTDIAKDLKNQQLHLTDYLLPMEKLEAAKRQEYLNQADSWEKTQDLDLLRSFGLSVDELNQNPIERHLRLSSIYLKPKAGSDLAFKVDFQNNEMAEWGLNLTDILPANVLKVDVYDQTGKLIFENAERGMKDGQSAYFEAKTGKPAQVQTGYSLKIKETQPTSALKERSHGPQAYKNALDESIYLTQNSAKTSVKEELRTQAEQQGRQLVMGPEFFDKVLTGVLGLFSAENWQKFNQNGKFDFDGLGNQLQKILDDASYAPRTDQKEIDAQLSQQEKIRQDQPPQKSITPSAEDRKPEKNNFKPLTPEEEKALGPFRAKTVNTARRYLGSKNFRGPEVSGGRLACAQVATTILKDAGALDQVILNVDGSEQALLKKGWRKHLGPPQAGDVIIWGRLPSTIVDGVSRPGHKHIGIMTSTTTCIDNNSNVQMPVERKVEFNTNRGIHYLSPPADLAEKA